MSAAFRIIATTSRGRTALPLVALVALPTLVMRAEAEPAKAPQSPTTPEVKTYCQNIANAAADARFAWQTQRLGELEVRIKARIGELDAKASALRDLLAKREEIERKAAEKLVGIYAKMRPETAATQISTLDDPMAAAVLSQLNPRQASAIFNEIVPERAAKLAGLIAGGNIQADEKKL